MSIKKIIDISYAQKNIDWKKVKTSGISGIIIRAGYGTTQDSQFKSHITGAQSINLPVGIYWFSYAYTDSMAKKEAETCLKIIKSYKIQLPVYFDWEYDSMRYAKQHGHTPGKSLITSMTKVFCKAIEAAGYKAGVYYNYDYKMNHYNLNDLKEYSFWYALYQNEVASGCDLQQFTSKGKVTGIVGNVDTNYLLNEKILQKTTAKKTTASKEKTTTPKKTTTKKTTVSYPVLPKRGYFTLNDKGSEVKKLQTLLNNRKFNCGAVDGIYGVKTTNAVKQLQKKYELVVDGKFGRKTLQTLKTI